MKPGFTTERCSCGGQDPFCGKCSGLGRVMVEKIPEPTHWHRLGWTLFWITVLFLLTILVTVK